MAVTTGLYPPIVMDTAPAFVRTGVCRIYFSLSMYNSATDIKNVQISLVNQRTNASAFKTDLYPSGIKLANLQYDPDKKGDYNYYIQINPKDLGEKDNAFGLNQFYKVQLRFTSISAPQLPAANQSLQDGTGLAKWLYDNMKYFSEWSKVCLIKGIDKPHISIRGFDDTGENQRTILTHPLIEIIGELTYNSGSQEQEYLKSYNIKLYQDNNFDNALVQSEEIYTNSYSPNEFNYQLSYDLLDSISYTMVLTYTTINLYTETINYDFTILQNPSDSINADMTATIDQENGKIKIEIVANDTEKFIGNLTIRRTSSKSNFHKWEDVKTITYITGAELNYTWYDTTIESGVWYKYCAQKRNALGDRGAIIPKEGTEPVMCLLDDIFLTRGDCQLKIKFNPSLNEFKYNVTESQQTALGAKYPYIKRNGSNYFRTFPIGGLISSFIDTTDWYDPHFYDGEFHNDENKIKNFTSKAEIYGETQTYYNNYNDEHNITEYNDYIYEREFRKKVYDFLYKHDVKLFRSTTEGNILIKLMNIDFQPVESLGRRLYSFTANAVQVDQANISNYDKYGIQTIGTYQKYIVYTHNVLGQISETFAANENILNKIDAKYKKISNEGFVNQVNSLKWLRIEIQSPPYVIVDGANGLVKATKSSSILSSNSTSGHIVTINNTEMVIYPRINRRSTKEITYIGIFELKENNTMVTNLSFKEQTTATIDFIANLEEVEDTSNLTSRRYYYYKPGQLYGVFEPQDSLMRKIYNKYFLDYNKYYQRLIDVTNIRVEGAPNTVFYVKDSRDTDFQRHVLANGQLELREDETHIEGLYFFGKHLLECKDPLATTTVNGLTEQDFVLQEGIYNSLNEITNPVNGGIYQLQTQGLKSGAFLQNHKVLMVNPEDVSNIVITLNNYYTLILDSIDDDEKVQFVYYYGSWYVLSKGRERAKILKGDIRHIRDDEYILVDGQYDSLNDITNPIPNGVYWVPSYAVDDDQSVFEFREDLLTVNENFIYTGTDSQYGLLISKLAGQSSSYIYYHNKWHPFTKNHDVMCSVEGIVDYHCEVMKGVY